MRMSIRAAFLAAFALAVTSGAAPAQEHAAANAHEGVTPPQQSWSFSGPFGRFDKAQVQRGFKIFKEVCSNCHSAHLLTFRSLAEPGGPEFTREQVAALAATYKVKDLDDKGETVDRPARPSDAYPAPYPNAAAAAAVLGKAPPDFSVLAKARTYERGFPRFVFDIFTQFQEQGPDYIAALLQGYEEPPASMSLEAGQNYNKYYPGHIIAMVQPLTDGAVDYSDGTPTTLQQYSKDVVSFMMWLAEPKLTERKRTGLSVMAFLVVFAGLLYYTKKRIWADVRGEGADGLQTRSH